MGYLRFLQSKEQISSLGLPYDVLARAPEEAEKLGRDRSTQLPLRSFIYIGVVQLISWNAILTCTSFLHDDVFTGMNWAFSSAIVYSACITFGTAAMLQGQLSMLPFGARWYLSILACSVSFLGLLIMVVLARQGRVSVEMGYNVAMICIVFMGLGSAVFQSTTFGLAGACDPQLSAKLMVGGGLAGIITGAASFLPPCTGTFGGLTFGAVIVMLVALLLFSLLLQNDEYIKPILEKLELDRVSPPSTPSLPGPADLPPPFEAPLRRCNSQIAQDVASPAIATFLVFVVTFLVFPGVTNEWGGAFGFSSTQFVQLMVGEFQIFDVVGRIFTSWVKTPKSRVVLGLSVARTVFVPLFIWAQTLEGSFLSSGAWKTFIMGAFGFSNGFVSTLGMMLGPKRVVCSEEREVAGTMMSLSLVSGITTGSMLALLA